MAFWMRSWQQYKMDDIQMLQAGIRIGVMEMERKDWGQVAGEQVYALGLEPGLETNYFNVHDQVVHLASIADIVTTAIRKQQEKPWGIPPPVLLGKQGLQWNSSAYIDPSGSHLRRIVLVSNWSDERHYSEARSYFSLGEVCAYGLPMQQVVIVLGQNRSGKRHSAWTKGFRHPRNKKLRFRKKNDVTVPFNSNWDKVWREDFSDISTHDWLQAMLDDGVLQDHCFTVQIDVPIQITRKHILDLMMRKLEAIEKLNTLPDEQMTGCDWPYKCQFRKPCHSGGEPKEGVFRVIAQ
jgi:hypothetical protein